MLPSDIPSAVYDRPALLAILLVAVAAAVHWQAGLSYREYILAHRLKCYLFSILNPAATRHGRPLVRTKGPAGQSDEFVTTVKKPPRAVARRLHGPFETHLVATAKARERLRPDPYDYPTKELQFAHSQWVTFYDIDGERWQTEVYLFERSHWTDVYAHAEPAVTDPQNHTEGRQLPGDAHGKFAEIFDG